MERNQKIVVITGAGSGIGRACAEKFIADGRHTVVAVEQSKAQLDRVVGELGAKGKADGYQVDVSSPVQTKEFANRIRKLYKTCDVLVNCAGVFRGGLLHESSLEDYEIQFSVNTLGIVNMMKHLIPLMLDDRAGGKAIVNVASLSGINGDYNAPLYCASKAAVIGLTKATALDYAEKGIRINSVSPSATKTPMFMNGSTDAVINSFVNALPDHRIGLPEEVANVIYFLASDESSHVIGNNIAVDGGLTAWNGQPKQNKEDA